jgi:putative ABC transport system permease protein
VEIWHRLFDEQAAGRPDSARVQLHVRVARDLPADPNAAYVRAQRLANSLEARIAGSGVVGNNLAARLDHVRADALYARVLFVFLGLPGVILACLLTLAVAGCGSQRRQREQALLRTRGASVAVVLRLSALEAASIGFGGTVLGLALTWIALASGLLGPALAWNGHVVWWVAGACLSGVCLAAAAVLYPAWREARRSTVVAVRAAIGRAGVPMWRRAWLDVILLLLAGFELWRVASTGYQVVLAPEGVASVSVHYEAFVGPLCLWLGGALLALRLTASGLKRGREIVSMLLQPIAGKLSATVAAALDRQRARLARGAMTAALAVSFAVSTAIFNETYQFQARVDAELTNGADVSITGLSAAFPATRTLAEMRKLPGVVAAQAMQHRYAYVGHDLQDIYGIDPQTLGEATHLSNAYFVGDARATLSALARQEDGVLVSDETVNDFQLHEGDELNLRLQRADDHQYHTVTCHFVGIAREFPTAPKDSFLVANASYLARQTGQANAETILIRASTDPGELAGRVRQLVGSAAGVKVSDIGSAQRLIGSNLTAVDLRGLTRLELSFAIVLVAGATGLVLALGLAERKRNLAILAALGAKQRQLAAFVWSEALVVLIGGGLVGAALGSGAALALVKVLTGVFDPPPESLAIPGNYLALLALAAVAATAAAAFGMIKFSRRSGHRRVTRPVSSEDARL